MEGDLEQRSGVQSRVSSAASSHPNEEEEEEEAEEVKASPTSLVSFWVYSSVFCTSRTRFIDIFVAKQGCCFL